MKSYEDKKYEQWRDATEQLLPVLMKKSLLTKVCPPRPPRHSGPGLWGHGLLLTLAKPMGVSKLRDWRETPQNWASLPFLGQAAAP